MSNHVCPKCERGVLRRSERRSFWERRVLPLFGIFPWRCSLCRARVTLSDRGSQRQYVDRQPRAGERKRRQV